MNQLLQRGANTPLNEAKCTMRISYENSTIIDLSLTNEEKVQDDQDMIFYNQPTSFSGVATFLEEEMQGSIIVFIHVYQVFSKILKTASLSTR